jgi:serine/threonine-protein kinase
MSSVYRAHDRLLERTVALKILHEQYTQDDDYVERFRREARAVAQLSHPNIVTVIDRGEFAGRQFIVFEYVDGQNLRQLVDRRGPLPIGHAIAVTLQVAKALAFAHQEGLVHRDVKPQNVLLSQTGQAKVTDFGIARALDVQGLTETGTVLGTSHYIAPEQAHGERVGAGTDVYSLAVVLYELLTGEVPFSGDNFVAVALRHVNEPAPSVRVLRPDVPARLDAALQRAMAKDPHERFGSMGEFVSELEACLDELGSEADEEATIIVPPPPGGRQRVPSRGRRRRSLLVAALLVALAAAAAGIVVFLAHDRDGGGTASAGKPPASAAAIQLRGIGAWDPPPGDGQEHDSEVGRATDGDAATFWRTEHYNSQQFGGLKDGVGLVLDAGQAVQPARLVVETDTPGFTAEVKAGASPTGPFSPVSGRSTVNGTTTFSLNVTSPQRYFVLWITELPPGGEAHVNEVRAG